MIELKLTHRTFPVLKACYFDLSLIGNLVGLMSELVIIDL